ncbi:MAG: sigma-70 family RNA polymerase sigma factor [Gemmatimonadaceae bacterium]|nr:sigma-70 family RNA polymerase sigma factor [Gemmatimonadaceae bacterium]
MTTALITALPSFEAVTLPLLPELLRFARSLTRDQATAEDLVQDVYLTALRSWDQYDPGSNCRNWLFTICRHRFYRISSRAQRQVPVDDAELESLAVGALTASGTPGHFVELLERDDLRESIRHAMVTLPEPFRDVALLVDWHELTYDAAATVLGVPVGTIRSRLFRARRILQQRLIEHARDAGLAAVATPDVPREDLRS